VPNPNFYSAFIRTLPWRPRKALGALFWHLTGRKVRARNRLRMAASQSPLAYAQWIDTVERSDETIAAAASVMAAWASRPRFSVIADTVAPPDETWVRRLITALNHQCYDHWELIVCGPGAPSMPLDDDPRVRFANCPADGETSSLPCGIAAASGDFVLPIIPGASLPPTALYRYAEALQDDPDADLLFGDEDQADNRNRRSHPWFKPRWNEEMFLSQDYVSHACAIRTESARMILPLITERGTAAAYALILRLIADPSARIVHIPHVQCHLAGPTPNNIAAHTRTVAAHLAATAPGATVTSAPFDTVHVSWPLPSDPPLVSIIIPTRDKMKLLRACVASVLEHTNYAPFEVIIIDNGSIEPNALRYLEEISHYDNVKVLPYDYPYNYSAINNFAVQHAKGDYLCLLNNDTEVIDACWLAELMRQAVRPHVGAVGAKLLYADGSIQHAGVVVGMGGAAGHAHRFLRNDKPGYFRQAHIAQYVSAVTAACLVVEKAKFLAVGGLDEEALQIAFNDVDLCLKLERAGWRNVYAPRAVMIHHESKSRGKDFSPKHIDRYLRELAVLQTRWETKTYRDPLHHPELDPASETFVIRL